MRLKVVTSAFLVFGVVLLVAWPWIVGVRPAQTAPEPERLRYLVRYSLYFLALIVTFFAAALGGFLIARRQREEFREETLDQLKELIEGTLEDHGAKKPDA